MATTTLDRLPRQSTTLNIKEGSYRLKDKRETEVIATNATKAETNNSSSEEETAATN